MRSQCTISDCPDLAASRGLCRRHYAAWQRSQPHEPRPPCSAEGCEKPTEARGLCSAHYHHVLMATERPPCSVEGCPKPARTKQLCNAHYVQMGRTGSPTGSLPRRVRRRCRVADCDQPAVGRDYCMKHWQRWKARGDALFNWDAVRPRKSPTADREKAHRQHTLRKAAYVERVDHDAIYDRDKGICGICGKAVPRDRMSLDHILPIACGGLHEARNVRLAHHRCNIRRQHRWPAQLRLLG